MRRCVIVGGAEIARYDRINSFLREDDFGLYCDGGLWHLPRLNLQPGLIVGDFDSHPRPDTSVETIVLPRAKDDTDTVYAAKEALLRGFDSFLLIGVTGGRMDHSLGNLSLLLYLDFLKKDALLVDDYSEMEIISDQPKTITDHFAYFSLIAVGGPAKGIDISGAKFPLKGGDITSEYQYGISNEVLPGQTARVSLESGRLLLIRVFRDPADASHGN